MSSLSIAPVVFETSLPPSTGNLYLYYTGGRLGNQLFELATAVSYAWEKRKTLILPAGQAIPKAFARNNLEFYNVLNIFKIPSTLSPPPFLQLPSPSEDSFTPFFDISHTHRYSPLPSAEKNIAIKGSFQSFRYFHHYRKALLSCIHFPQAIKNSILKKYQKALEGNSVCVHIRRGDYATCNYHLLDDKNYYQKALSSFSSQTPILVFTDDLEEAKKLKAFQRFSHTTWVNEKTFESLYLMSCCKNHVIANSSFSWWGAYLSKNGHKKSATGKVICPLISPKNSYQSKDLKDHFLPHWKVL